MNLVIDGKKLRNLGLAAGLLAFYFSGLSILGVSLVVPYAFLWLMWTLNGVKSGLDRQARELEKIAAR